MITLQKGRYEALELIGSGTTSRVERARDNVIGRTVALKTFIRSFRGDLRTRPSCSSMTWALTKKVSPSW